MATSEDWQEPGQKPLSDVARTPYLLPGSSVPLPDREPEPMTTPDLPACNIGPQGRRKRLIAAVPLLLIGVVASFLSRSFLGQAVAFFGFLAWYQALDGVCVAHAARGSINLDDGLGRRLLEREQDIEHFGRQSRRIYFKAFFSTLALMLVARAYLYWFD